MFEIITPKKALSLNPNDKSRYIITSNDNDGMHPDEYHRICDLKINSIVGIIDDFAIAKGLVKKLERIERLEAENERLVNALDYLLESGALSSFDDVLKAKWGLGLQVDDEPRIAALKPRFS